ncbi:MAG: hypothetical protein AB7N54_16145 [Alphaproteobacteria bacterium]
MVEARPAIAPYLLEALRSANETARSYDTKAQISGLMLILSINPLFLVLNRLAGDSAPDAYLVIALLSLLILNVCLFGAVLMPQRNPFGRIRFDRGSVRHTFYVAASDPRGLEQRVADARQTDWESELQFEIMKVSAIRDAKHARFMAAMAAAAVSYVLIIVILVWIAAAPPG